jgi:hypothetical protein
MFYRTIQIAQHKLLYKVWLNSIEGLYLEVDNLQLILMERVRLSTRGEVV